MNKHPIEIRLDALHIPDSLSRIILEYALPFPSTHSPLAMTVGESVVYLLDKSKHVYAFDLNSGNFLQIETSVVSLISMKSGILTKEDFPSVILIEERAQVALIAKSNQIKWEKNTSEYYPYHIHSALKRNEMDGDDHSVFHVFKHQESEKTSYHMQNGRQKVSYSNLLFQSKPFPLCECDNFRSQPGGPSHYVLFQSGKRELTYWDLEKRRTLRKYSLGHDSSFDFDLFSLHQNPPYIITLSSSLRMIFVYEWEWKWKWRWNYAPFVGELALMHTWTF